MSDILSRKELEHGEDAPGWRLCHYSPAEYQRTALWLAKKGRLAALACDSRCERCPYDDETCRAEPCQTAARELLKWWGE